MELISTEIAAISLVTIFVTYFVVARFFVFDALSLPCVAILTSLIYFYLMPVLSYNGGDNAFLNVYLTNLDWPYVAVLLYLAGMLLACFLMRRTLTVDPSIFRSRERVYGQLNWLVLVAISLGGVIVQVLLGRLQLGTVVVSEAVDSRQFAFVNLLFTMFIPLALVYLIRDNFRIKSLIFLVFVLLVLLQTGFRYRLIIMAFAVASTFALTRGWRIRTGYVIICTLFGLLANNAMVNSRTYGKGIDIAKLADFNFTELMQSFGGEVGPIFAFSFTASSELTEMITIQPWIVGISRLIPSFIWPDKPGPEYLDFYFGAFAGVDAKAAGVAAPQHVEMLLQFGWVGLPVLAFLYFFCACLLVAALLKLGREARMTGLAIVPAFFGFYMQTRGYFFQMLSDAIFLFLPLFLLHLGDRIKTLRSKSATSLSFPPQIDGRSVRYKVSDAKVGQ